MTLDEAKNAYETAKKNLETTLSDINFLKNNPIIEMAELLHEWLCRWNHTDGCAWHYQSWEKPGWDREQYVKMAERVLKVTDVETIKLIMKAIKE